MGSNGLLLFVYLMATHGDPVDLYHRFPVRRIAQSGGDRARWRPVMHPITIRCSLLYAPSSKTAKNSDVRVEEDLLTLLAFYGEADADARAVVLKDEHRGT
jgi:hypothetical protein